MGSGTETPCEDPKGAPHATPSMKNETDCKAANTSEGTPPTDPISQPLDRSLFTVKCQRCIACAVDCSKDCCHDEEETMEAEIRNLQHEKAEADNMIRSINEESMQESVDVIHLAKSMSRQEIEDHRYGYPSSQIARQRFVILKLRALDICIVGWSFAIRFIVTMTSHRLAWNYVYVHGIHLAFQDSIIF